MTVIIWNVCHHLRGIYYSKWSLGFIITLPVSSHQRQKERIAIVSQQNNSSTNTTAGTESAFYPGVACLHPRVDTNSLVWRAPGRVFWWWIGGKSHKGKLSELFLKNRTVKIIKHTSQSQVTASLGVMLFSFLIRSTVRCQSLHLYNVTFIVHCHSIFQQTECGTE